MVKASSSALLIAKFALPAFSNLAFHTESLTWCTLVFYQPRSFSQMSGSLLDCPYAADAACRTLIGIGGVDVLSWGTASPQDSLQSMLQAVSRLLQPGMGDSASLYVGDLILQILLKMPAQVSKACCAALRLASAQFDFVCSMFEVSMLLSLTLLLKVCP